MITAFLLIAAGTVILGATIADRLIESSNVDYAHEGATELHTIGDDMRHVPPAETINAAEIEAAELARRAEREAQLEINRMFERFDRIVTNGMTHVDAVNRVLIERWIALGDDLGDGTGELHLTHLWLDHETDERELLKHDTAHALLVS